MAGLEIILPTRFNNPLLPIMPVYGFKDTFNRADTTSGLGVTSGEGKTWENMVGFGGVFRGRISGGRAVPVRESASWAVEAVDAQASNGTLRATLATAGSRWGGLTFRAKSATDFLHLVMRQTTTNTKLVLNKKVGNTTTLVASSELSDLAADGAVFEVVMAGASVTVKRNGVVVIPTQTITDHTTATKHGLYFQDLGLDMAWDDVEFIPA